MTTTRRTSSQTTPSDSEGATTMTSTTTAHRDPVASIGAAAAGTEHTPAGREEATPGSTAGAGSPEEAGRAQRLVWLDPAGSTGGSP